MPEFVTYVSAVRNKLSDRLPVLEDRLLDLYTLLVLTTGEDTTLENVHDAWSLWKREIRPDHRSMIPFEGLKPEIQEMDRKYAEAIRATAASLKKVRQGT